MNYIYRFKLCKGPLGFLWDCDIINGDHCDLNDAFSCSCPLVCRPRVHGYPWRLVYSTVVHGTSLKTLYRNLMELDCPVLMVIKDMDKPGTCTTVTDWWNRLSHVKRRVMSPADLWSIFHSPVQTEWALLWDRRDLPLQLLPRDQGVLLTYIVL